VTIPARLADTTSGRVDLNRRKQMKINESKIAFICFLLFTFIFSNRDFSMGYGGFKQNFFSRPREPAPVAKRARVMLVGAVAEFSAIEFLIAEIIAPGFFFAQENVDKFWNSIAPQHRRADRN
jgi:hypothetical protein